MCISGQIGFIECISGKEEKLLYLRQCLAADTKDIVKMEINHTDMDIDTIYTEQSLQILRIPDGVQKRPILSSRDVFSIPCQN